MFQCKKAGPAASKHPLARTTNHFTKRLLKSLGTLLAIGLLSACGGDQEPPCARTEDACLVTFPEVEDYWWDVPITDFSDNPDRPDISLLGDRTVVLNMGAAYVEAGATAVDAQDGDISAQIVISGQVNTGAIGDYLVRYGVTDSSGTVAIEKTRIVRVVGSTVERFSRRPLGDTIANFGYLEHLPVDYGQSSDQKPPLLIYLHGGDGNLEFTTTTDTTLVLDAVIDNYGIPKLIEDGDWDNSLPFVVLAPQLGGVPNTSYRVRLEAFLEYAVRTYDIDTSRVYFTGYSQGGFLSAAFAKDFPHRIAAVASIASAFPNFIDPEEDNFCDIEQVPLWLFHATGDGVIPYQNSLRVYNQILDYCQPPIPPRMSLIMGAEHAIHHAVYNLEALVGGFAQAVYDPAYYPYDENVYQWLLSHSLEDR